MECVQKKTGREIEAMRIDKSFKGFALKERKVIKGGRLKENVGPNINKCVPGTDRSEWMPNIELEQSLEGLADPDFNFHLLD